MKALQFIDSFRNLTKIFYLFGFLCLLSACGSDSTINEAAKDVEKIKIIRFDSDLLKVDTAHIDPNHFKNLAQKYGDFYFGFCENTLAIMPQTNDPYFANSLVGFIRYPGIQIIKQEVDSVFPNLTDVEDGISLAMSRYKAQFKNAKIPRFISYISEFGEAHNAYDSIIGIGLDMYLGSNYQFYPQDFPEFMRAKMRREYIVPNTLKAIAIANFDTQLKDKRFLAYMLFEAKVRYFTKQLLPELDDTLVFGYTKKQMDWCQGSEAQIWSYFVDQKLLYNQQPNDYMRYLNDGPFTAAVGIPQESAPALGVFCGYKILENYVSKTNASLQEVMAETNWDEILKKSAYRPK
ncbi:MAG: hypothetical protein V4538_17455 [Bacteroidota bacterium]